MVLHNDFEENASLSAECARQPTPEMYRRAVRQSTIVMHLNERATASSMLGIALTEPVRVTPSEETSSD